MSDNVGHKCSLLLKRPSSQKLTVCQIFAAQMCKLQHSYYNQCIHRICRITAVCRNRNLPGSKCRGSTNLYLPGRCSPCTREQPENGMFDAQKPNDRFVDSSKSSETSDTKPAKPCLRRCTGSYPRLDVPALPDSPASSEDEHSPTSTVQQTDRQEALQRLKLTGRFAKPLISGSTLIFNSVSYATTPKLESNTAHIPLPKNSVLSLVDYYNGLDSGYESSGTVHVSPTSSSPPKCPTTLSSNDRLTILSGRFEPDNTDCARMTSTANTLAAMSSARSLRSETI